MAKLTAVMGIPGCGKSTLVEALLMMVMERPTVVICPDDLRAALTGDPSDQTRNAEVFEMAHERARWALNNGLDVIWDATNVTGRARAEIQATAGEATTHLLVLDVPLALAKQRNRSRERVVPEPVLDRMFGQFHDSLSQLLFEGWNTVEYERIS